MRLTLADFCQTSTEPSFVAPAKIAKCIGEGVVIRSGRNVIFVEGKLWNADNELAVHATATLMGHKV